jgi:hypothetical protein
LVEARHTNGAIRKVADGYLAALGVVAASPFLPEKNNALAYVGKMLGTEFHRELFPDIQDVYRHLMNIDNNRFFSVIGESNQFQDATAGELMLSEFRSMYSSEWFVAKNLPAFSDFFEKFEKTRSYLPVWDKAASWINDFYTRISENPGIGRKDQDIAKVLRLTKDGADLVSVSECAEATDKLFLALVHPERSDCEAFVRNLDILDDHGSFYAVAFQSSILSNMDRGGGIQNELARWPHEKRDDFRKNLAELAQRIESKVADTDILLGSLLLGKTLIESMTLKDRAQGKAKWLESAILAEARNPRQLMDPQSALSVVMDTLLSRYEPAEVSAFWKENTGGERYIAEEYRRHSPSGDNGYGR